MNIRTGTGTRLGARLTQFFLLFVGALALVALVMNRVHTPKVHADVKAVETFECDPDTNVVVHSAGPFDFDGGACTSAIMTLSQHNFVFQNSRGPEAIFRQHLTGGTDDGPGHSYYLMIFWED